MRKTAPGSGCAPPDPQNGTAATGVGARHGSKSEQAGKPLTRTSNHTLPNLTSRTVIALFNDEGAVIGFDLFGQRSDARAFMRAGGAA